MNRHITAFSILLTLACCTAEISIADFRKKADVYSFPVSYPLDATDSLLLIKPTTGICRYDMLKNSSKPGSVVCDSTLMLDKAYAYLVPENIRPRSEHGTYVGKLVFSLTQPLTQPTTGVFAHGYSVLIYSHPLTPQELEEYAVPWDGAGFN
jgi:hypothetical protein